MCYTPSHLDFAAQKAYQVLTQNLDKTVIITFKKRTNGEARRMVAICYSRHNGTFTTQSGLKKGLFQVWDCEKGDRRSVPLENIWTIKAGNAVLFDQFETVQAEMDMLFG